VAPPSDTPVDATDMARARWSMNQRANIELVATDAPMP
jgi:hypothetical protein